MKDFEDPYNMDLTTPDAYTKNHGVEVEQNLHDPQYGQIKVKFKHNEYQSTKLLMGLEQAKELHEKLGEAILAAEFDLNAAWKFITESYEDWSPSRKDWRNKDLVEFVREYHVEGLTAIRRAA